MDENNKNRYSQIRHEFLQKYNSELLPFLLKFESERKSVLLKANILFALSLAAVLALLYIYLAPEGKKEGEIFMLLAIPPSIWFWFQHKFETKIKERIMPKVCKCFGNLVWMNEITLNITKQTLGERFYESSGLVPASDMSKDDIFIGDWDGVNIDIVESSFSTGSGKNRHSVFDGVFVVLDMNKSFSGHTVIKPKQFIDLKPFKHLNEIKLEDVEFNKTYKVYSTDEVEARYLVTPSFMERLKRMKVAFSADNVRCAFFDKYLIIGLATTKDLFSIASIKKPMNDSKQYFQMFEEMLSIIKLIDHFKLNQKIGL